MNVSFHRTFLCLLAYIATHFTNYFHLYLKIGPLSKRPCMMSVSSHGLLGFWLRLATEERGHLRGMRRRRGVWLSGASLRAELGAEAPARPCLPGGGLPRLTVCTALHPGSSDLGEAVNVRGHRAGVEAASHPRWVPTALTDASVKAPGSGSSQIASLECGSGLTWTQMSYPFSPSIQRWEEIHIQGKSQAKRTKIISKKYMHFKSRLHRTNFWVAYFFFLLREPHYPLLFN